MFKKLSGFRRPVKGMPTWSRTLASEASEATLGYILVAVPMLAPPPAKTRGGMRGAALAAGSLLWAAIFAERTIAATAPPFALPLELCGRTFWLPVARQALLVVADLSDTSRAEAALLDAYIGQRFPDGRDHPRVMLGTPSGGVFALRQSTDEHESELPRVSALTVAFDQCQFCHTWIARPMEPPSACHVCGTSIASGSTHAEH